MAAAILIKFCEKSFNVARMKTQGEKVAAGAAASLNSRDWRKTFALLIAHVSVA